MVDDPSLELSAAPVTAREVAGLAQARLFDDQRAGLTRLAFLLTGSRPVAEELVQDAFEQVVRRWDAIHAPAGYVRIAVISGARSWGRRKRPRVGEVRDDVRVDEEAIAVRTELASSVDLVAVGDEVFVIGRASPPAGCGELRVLVYTPSSNTWREIPAGPAARLADPVAVWTGSELFVGGGGGSCAGGAAAEGFEDSAYLLDPATGAWRAAATAPEGFSSSYRYPDIWTGEAVATISPTGRPLLYDPSTDDWDVGPSIDPAQPIAPNQTPVVLVGDHLAVSGGAIAERGSPGREPFSGTYAYSIPDRF